MALRKPCIAVIGLKGLPAFGGSARAGENMIAELRDSYDFVIFNTASHTDRKTGTYDGVRQVVFRELFRGPFNTLWYYVRSLFACLLGKGYDAVHVFHMDAAFIVPILRLRYPVLAGHRARPQEFSKWGRVARLYFGLMERIFYGLPADVITTVSPVIASRYQSWTSRRIVYVPNGVSSDDFEPAPARYPDYLLFASGRVMETKGAHVFLEALRTLEYRGKVLVLGNLAHDHGYERRLRKLARGLDVEFVGLVKEKHAVLSLVANARLFVHPSFHEGMSNMLLEAGSTGVPVVASDIPENRAIFEDDETIFFRCGDSSDLAERIRWALEHGEEAARIAERGRKKVRQCFAWKSIAEHYDALYTWLVEERRPLLTREEGVRSFGRSLPGCGSDAC